uniref:Uncharacterized protein n=1 Tax=Myoviridae sp. ctSGr1 TaxID=2827609 RepID=A0A8S5LRA5_9CAUD|nr:MAG TPA: hypothetical protein [Myoviridae sp. ctSGr1]
MESINEKLPENQFKLILRESILGATDPIRTNDLLITSVKFCLLFYRNNAISTNLLRHLCATM